MQVFDQCFTFLTLRDQLDAQQKHLLWVEEMQLAHWLIFFVWVQEKRTTKPEFVAQGSLRSTFRNNFLQLATFLLRHKLITQCEKRETSTHDLQRNSVAGQVESFLSAFRHLKVLQMVCVIQSSNSTLIYLHSADYPTDYLHGLP